MMIGQKQQRRNARLRAALRVLDRLETLTSNNEKGPVLGSSGGNLDIDPRPGRDPRNPRAQRPSKGSESSNE